jgi:broad specificity phosphatase PhoE
MRTAEFISHVELFFRRPGEKVLGRETADGAFERFDTAVAGVMNSHPSGNVAVVSHGTVIALLLARRADQNAFEVWRGMGLPSFVVLAYPDLNLIGRVDRV